MRPQPDFSGFISPPGAGEAVFLQLLRLSLEPPRPRPRQGENFVDAPVGPPPHLWGRQHYFHCSAKGTETREFKGFARSPTVSGGARIHIQVYTLCIAAFLPSLMRCQTETSGRESDQDLDFTLPL